MIKLLARFCGRPAVARWIIRRAMAHPYSHLDGYMRRWWFFNPYEDVPGMLRFRWLPWAFRVHHILRADEDRHLHNHPWDARTIILRGWYVERREFDGAEFVQALFGDLIKDTGAIVEASEYFTRRAGDTAVIGHDTYHSITEVSPGGVWTLFITTEWRHVWGFKVNGVHVPWREYLQRRSGK